MCSQARAFRKRRASPEKQVFAPGATCCNEDLSLQQDNSFGVLMYTVLLVLPPSPVLGVQICCSRQYHVRYSADDFCLLSVTPRQSLLLMKWTEEFYWIKSAYSHQNAFGFAHTLPQVSYPSTACSGYSKCTWKMRLSAQDDSINHP